MTFSTIFKLTLPILLFSCNSVTNKSYESSSLTDTIPAPKKTIELTIKGDVKNGGKLFKANCRACHTLSNKKIDGPGMQDVFARVPQPAEIWIRKYILSASSVRRENDSYALQLYKDCKNTPMPDFKNVLSEQEINDIIYFLYYKTNH